MQRFFDILIAGVTLLVFLPVMAVVALVLRCTGEGEIFFRQERIGEGGRIFGLLKFATMLKNSPSIGTGTVTVKGDPRVLPIGRFLRKTKLNELPQLLNILWGDMSIVGPRPQTQRCFDAFAPAIQALIVRVPPGLTGIGSVVFAHEEEMVGDADAVAFYDQVIAPYKGELEAWYLRHRTLRTYFTIILITPRVVFVPDSGIAWKVFPDLPLPPARLVRYWRVPEARLRRGREAASGNE